MTAGSAFLADFYQQLRRSWSIETSSGWQPGNPASGQCGVTALVVQDKLGGEILKTDVNGAWHSTTASMEGAWTSRWVNSIARLVTTMSRAAGTRRWAIARSSSTSC
jgi:hypothetical protein